MSVTYLLVTGFLHRGHGTCLFLSKNSMMQNLKEKDINTTILPTKVTTYHNLPRKVLCDLKQQMCPTFND